LVDRVGRCDGEEGDLIVDEAAVGVGGEDEVALLELIDRADGAVGVLDR
jgi:hypothetical protein